MSSWPKTTDCDGQDNCSGRSGSNNPGSRWGFRSHVSLATTIAALLIALAVTADWFGWFGELASAMGWRIATAGFMLSIIQLFTGHRRCAAVTAAASCFMLVPTLLQSPRAPSPSSQGARLGLLIANVHALNETPDELLEMLSKSDADVLILTEPPPAVMRALRPGESLALKYPNIARSIPDRGLHAWLVVASRWPLTKVPGAIPGMNPVVISAEGNDIALIATHLISPRSPARYRQARIQTRTLASKALELTTRDLPLILAGDLNAPPGSHLSRRLAGSTGTVRTKPRHTLAGSWPTLLPSWASLPIDGALVSPGIAIERWDLVILPGSDHRGLRIDLIVPNADSDTQSQQSGSSPSNP